MDNKAVDVAADGTAALGFQPAKPSAGMAAGVLMCLLSMSSIQFGAALSAPVIATYGVAGATWLRLAFAAIILAAIVRPPILRYSRAQWLATLVLGTTTAAMTLCFFAAIQRLPLGLAIAIDFLGPLAVAVFGFGLTWRLLWPVVAGIGILFLAHDGQGWVGDITGILFAAGSAVGWAIYIVLTKKVGAVFKGLEGLSMSLLVAGVVSAPFGLMQTIGAFTPASLVSVLGLAILVPLLPYALEMIALRRMPAASFGILMSLEPAIGAFAGFLILAQPMTILQMMGTALVVAASAGATFSTAKA